MANDNALVLKTKVDTSGIDKGLDDVTTKTKQASKETDKYGDAAEKAGNRAVASFNKVSLAIKAATAAMVAGTAKIVKSSIDAFAEYEQLAGGVEKIFDKANIKQIQRDADNAYKELGMSANQYMSIINDVGASFAATMGDQRGYEAARKGLTSISDYASGTGKSMNELSQKLAMITRSTSSYQSIADQFSGILPATSADFLAQAQAAGFLSKEYKKLTDVPIADYQMSVTQMLELGVQNLNLAGNTAREAATTISGSASMMKASWNDLLASMGNPDSDIPKAIDKFTSSFHTAFENLVPKVKLVMKNLADVISAVAPQVVSVITTALLESLPNLLEVIGAMIWGVFEGIVQGIYNLFSDDDEKQDSLQKIEDTFKSLTDSMKNDLPIVGEEISDTTEKVEKLKKSLLGFDELNILSIKEELTGNKDGSSPTSQNGSSANAGESAWDIVDRFSSSEGGFWSGLIKGAKMLTGTMPFILPFFWKNRKGGGGGDGGSGDGKLKKAAEKLNELAQRYKHLFFAAEGARQKVEAFNGELGKIPASIPELAPQFDLVTDSAIRGAEVSKNYFEVFPYGEKLVNEGLAHIVPQLDAITDSIVIGAEGAKNYFEIFPYGQRLINESAIPALDQLKDKVNGLFDGLGEGLEDAIITATNAALEALALISLLKKFGGGALPPEVPEPSTTEEDARVRTLRNLAGIGVGASALVGLEATDWKPSGFLAEQVDQLVGVVKTFVGDMFGAAVEDVEAVGNFGGELVGALVDAGKQMGKEVGGSVLKDIIKVAKWTRENIPEDAGELAMLVAALASGNWAAVGSTVPALASGAVIPPGREFLAKLGDQKSGMNLEAPEGLIRKIVREETQGNMGADSISVDVNFTGTEAGLLRYLSPKVTVTNNKRGKNIITGGQA